MSDKKNKEIKEYKEIKEVVREAKKEAEKFVNKNIRTAPYLTS